MREENMCITKEGREMLLQEDCSLLVQNINCGLWC